MAGRIVAGRLVRLASERHLRDLVEGKARGLIWRVDLARYAIDFFPFLRHSKGEWGGQPIELTPWQAFCIGSVFGWTKRDGERRFRVVFEEVARKNGKAEEVNTPVATPEGWKRHGELKPGDFVFGPDGRPKRVLRNSGTYLGPCYAMRFSDGCEIVAHAAHEWHTERRAHTGRPHGSRQPLPLVETQEIARTLRHGARGEFTHGIYTACPLVLFDADLLIPPYTFGTWLADGNSSGIAITTPDQEVVQAIRDEEVPIRQISGRETSLAGRYSLAGGQVTTGVLRALGVLNNKHIPLEYLRASIAQRRDLLAGIVDGDGYVTAKGQVEVTLTRRALVDGVVELARTLGHKPTVTESRALLHGRDMGPRWRIQFWPASDELPLRVPRKRDRLRRVVGNRSRKRMIVECKSVGQRSVNCIEVEGGFYLCGDAMIPTHNSTLLAGVGIYTLVADHEPGAEIYAAATKKDQARIIFDEAKRMVRSSPDLRSRVGIYKTNLSVDATASKFEPLSSDDRTLDGLNPHVVLIDELHKHRSRALLEVMDSAVGARRQPLLWIITTAGDDDPESVYASEHAYATKVLEGVVQDDSWFAYIATIDQGDRWDDPAVWIKANPNLGVSVKFDDLERQASKARNSPPSQAEFKRLRLNVRQSSTDKAINMDVWRRNSRGPFDPDELRDRRCYAGLDLSSKIDLSAWVKLFEPERDGDPWRVVARFWMPADTVSEKSDRDQAQYQRWIDAGLIDTTPGNVIDHDEIRRTVMEDCRLFDIQSIAFDPWNAAHLSTQLTAEGAPMTEFIQGVRSYSAPTKELEAMLLSEAIDHGDNEVLAWMAANLRITQPDRNQNVMPTKKHSTGRIDGLTALIMAIGRSMAADPNAGLDGYLSGPLIA